MILYDVKEQLHSMNDFSGVIFSRARSKIFCYGNDIGSNIHHIVFTSMSLIIGLP